MSAELRFESPDGAVQLSVSASCVQHLQSHRQTRIWQRESGGLLFAPTIGSADHRVDITSVTGPNSADRRARHSLSLNHRRCIENIAAQFDFGLHFVGYWHTHPEPHPRLSGIDHIALVGNLLDGGIVLERMIAMVIGNGTSTSSISAYLVEKDQVVLMKCPGVCSQLPGSNSEARSRTST